MKQPLEIRVPFTRENANKCMCPECPVQADSCCVKQNSQKMGDVMTTEFFQPQIIPALYCSSGFASCKDIDPERSCICGACDVYNNYRLGNEQPLDHFCKNGNAK